MRIETGKGSIPVTTLLAIWSISAITSLPGLAVSPILGELQTIFPHTSQLEIQMLTSIPSLLIIPFVLLSGKLCESKDKIRILVLGLAIFLISGILYFFAKSMTSLILISCLLGVGSGIIIPLSTGLIAYYFHGKYRTKQMGLSSSITNVSLVLATFLTGWLANFNWHYPFIVYLLPVAALILSRFLREDCTAKSKPDDASKSKTDLSSACPLPAHSPYIKEGKALNGKALTGLILTYYMATLSVLVILYNLPFVMEKHKLSSDYTGGLISLFFLAIMMPGFYINKIIRVLKNNVFVISFLALCAGLLIVVFLKSIYMIGLGVMLTGYGYGIMQPVIYDKATLMAKPEKTILALGIVMSINYAAILTSPFIVKILDIIFHQKSQLFPFIINAAIALIMATVAFIFRKSLIYSSKSSIE